MNSDIKAALRDSKSAARPYVLVNPMLAKHLPVTPSHSLEYFSLLGAKVSATCKDERVLVIGFAETATAVGASVALAINNAVYVHTTREELSVNLLLSEFLEEHSHAKNQGLYLAENLRNLNQYDRIVFVEDEITTGNTILNFLRSVDWSGNITVSALIFNGFNESVFSQYCADFICLQKKGYVTYIEADSVPNPRLGVNISMYNDMCVKSASQIIALINESDICSKRILVIGTEEFMYPALVLGRELEKTAKTVMTQSTTRSPLLPKNNSEYPLYSRLNFASVYDCNRTTYLYNMELYDTVIVVTDSQAGNFGELLQVIQNSGNRVIYCVRLCDGH